jgi:hypothetical protein
MTPKDAAYKVRQVEFRKLNSKNYGYSVRKGNLDKSGFPVLEAIVHKEKYTGLKGV